MLQVFYNLLYVGKGGSTLNKFSFFSLKFVTVCGGVSFGLSSVAGYLVLSGLEKFITFSLVKALDGFVVDPINVCSTDLAG